MFLDRPTTLYKITTHIYKKHYDYHRWETDCR